MTNLSTIFKKADKELHWGKGNWYDLYSDKHCAIGAILHYILGHDRCLKSCSDPMPNSQQKQQFKKLIALIDERLRAAKLFPIGIMNDRYDWTFYDFYKFCNKNGI